VLGQEVDAHDFGLDQRSSPSTKYPGSAMRSLRSFFQGAAKIRMALLQRLNPGTWPQMAFRRRAIFNRAAQGSTDPGKNIGDNRNASPAIGRLDSATAENRRKADGAACVRSRRNRFAAATAAAAPPLDPPAHSPVHRVACCTNALFPWRSHGTHHVCFSMSTARSS